MPYSITWNAAFGAVPADIDNASEGASKIRDLKTAVQERLAKDHYFAVAGTDADHGEHVKVSLRVGAAPGGVANKGMLYAKDVSAKAELFYQDEDGDEVQLTSGGDVAVSVLTTAAAVTAALAAVYPIGCIYTTTVSTNPATVFGFGTWTAFGAGRVPVGYNATDTDFDLAEKTGGAKTHALVTAEMPAHVHTVGYRTMELNGGGGGNNINSATGNNATVNTSSVGSGTAHNNVQPYIVVYFWKRTA